MSIFASYDYPITSALSTCDHHPFSISFYSVTDFSGDFLHIFLNFLHVITTHVFYRFLNVIITQSFVPFLHMIIIDFAVNFLHIIKARFLHVMMMHFLFAVFAFDNHLLLCAVIITYVFVHFLHCDRYTLLFEFSAIDYFPLCVFLHMILICIFVHFCI